MRKASGARQAGFTIIELLVVVVVIGIIASIALVSMMNALDKAKQRATMADMRTISKSLEAYMVDNHLPPSYTGGVSALVTVLTPYHSSVLPTQDHWRNEYQYTGDNNGYTIESFGKDGIDGTDISVANQFNYAFDIVIANGVFVASPE